MAGTLGGAPNKAFGKAYAGTIGNTVLYANPRTVTAVTVNGGAAGGTLRLFDNATTNSGNVLFAVTLAANQIETFPFPVALRARNGITANASAALGASSLHVMNSSAQGVAVKSYTGGLTAATLLENHPVTFSGLTVNASNTGGASTITVWDNAAGAATGTILWQKTIPTQTAANTQLFSLPMSVKASAGLTVTVATTAVGDITFWLN